MTYLLFDLVTVAVLAFFAWRGWRKGLLLSLCGLAAAVAAFFGAGFLADTLDSQAAEAVMPLFEPVIEETVSQYGGLGLDETAQALREQGGLYRWIADAAQSGEAALSNVSESIGAAARSVVESAVHSVLFAAAFLLLYLLLSLVIRGLDLVARLPGLRFCNGLGGGAVGLVKGALVLFVLIGVLMVSSLRPAAETVGQTCLFKYFVQYDPLVALLLPE